MSSLQDLAFDNGALVKFLLVLIRCGTMIAIFPVFSAKQIPVQVKIAITAMLSFVIAGTLPTLEAPPSTFALVGEIMAQVFIGFAIGSLGTFIFAGIQFAGEIIDTQVGFAITNVINPNTQTSVTVLGQFELILATMIFLITDSHHLLISGMANSFTLVPLPLVNVQPILMHNISLFFGQAIDIVFKIAVPIAVALMITNIAMGLLARVAPQVNVFIVAFPAQIGIGMIMFAISLPLLGYILPVSFEGLGRQMTIVSHNLGPTRTP